MLNVKELKELIKALDESNVDELKFEQDGTKLQLKKQQTLPVASEGITSTPPPAPVAVAQPPAPTPAPSVVKEETAPPAVEKNENVHTITSPMVGTFYSSPSPDADAYVKQGDLVTESSIICIVEAMKLMNEIEAEVKGKIVEVLAENGELVEYGQPLFVVELG
ncbi:acetyl-CoA carboxylase biotin carboxyl carrier protein [Bacillus suaedae]|uniref:Biotin carboxyl carrier protein of acetyl-CoA carboxylase n=1 Tax=Halalkalibacter suaedae TaxID=2822140 RepID=A0A940WX82_9BACI|nr:acetyl-CoA carboxylase biotin carboxyl carrier protein [Bacillus suaedae]MBP3952307.1 acetyl-CoA carboxylase biotin carboxyl carrier protein [Bacillus suaedae]